MFSLRQKLLVVRAIINLQNVLIHLLRILFFGRRILHEPRTILLYRTGRLGDFIVSIPAMVALRKRFPQAFIALLTTTSTMQSMQGVTASYAEIGNTFPWLSFVEPELINRAVTFSVSNRKSGLAQVRNYVNELNPDATFILPFSGEGLVSRLRKMVFFRLAGVHGPVYGCKVHSTSGLMRDTQYRLGMFEHQVFGPLRAIMECPLVPYMEEKDVKFSLTIDEDSETWAQDLWEQEDLKSRKVIAIFPGGTFPHKIWPVEKFMELCKELKRDKEVEILVIGADKDKILCEQFCNLLEETGCINLGGKTSLYQLAALFKRCSLFIGNDSGPAHLASAIGCPCVTIISSIEYPGFWEPWNSRDKVIRKSVPCEYCFSYTVCPLGTNECIAEIQVKDVLGMCNSVLAREQVANTANAF